MAIARKITQFTKQEIDQLWQKVHPVVKSDGFLLLKAPRQGSFGRILIVIPKKIGTAPVRNKLRRQIKAIFYEHAIYQKDFDWIILLKKITPPLSFQELQKLLLGAMENPSDS